MRVGDPDGHGVYGELSTAGARLVCHECGRDYLHLATHIAQTHGMTADQYRRAHGLPLTLALVAASVSRRMSQSWEANRDLHLAALDRSRDPNVARTQVRTQSEWTAATRVARARMLSARRGRLLTPEEMQELGDDVPLTEWCARVRQMMADDPTLTTRSFGRSFDRSPEWAEQRLRRYPPPQCGEGSEKAPSPRRG